MPRQRPRRPSRAVALAARLLPGRPNIAFATEAPMLSGTVWIMIFAGYPSVRPGRIRLRTSNTTAEAPTAPTATTSTRLIQGDSRIDPPP